ncbi:MAG TPA: hypothetical protein VHL99_08000 [Candidatus Binatia bacterium]|jgi:hypothetical protein|nr:hypothetical protein [Candidatus Binatia bacterium]
MARLGSTWIVMLRCYSGESLFTLKRIAAIAIKVATDASHCSKCGSKKIPGFPPIPNRHVVLKLRKSGPEA